MMSPWYVPILLFKIYKSQFKSILRQRKYDLVCMCIPRAGYSYAYAYVLQNYYYYYSGSRLIVTRIVKLPVNPDGCN